MSTRSLTEFQDCEVFETICTIYKHHDGYPNGYGRALAEFLKDAQIVDGVAPNELGMKKYVGLGELIVEVIKHFSTNSLDLISVEAVGTRDIGEEWLYRITLSCDKKLTLQVFDCHKYNDKLADPFEIMRGTPAEVCTMIDDSYKTYVEHVDEWDDDPQQGAKLFNTAPELFRWKRD